MRIGDLVKAAYDKDKYRIGIVLRISNQDSYSGEVAHVLWNSTPVGLYQTGPAWVKDLEVISEGR